MQLREFLSIAEGVHPEEVGPMARLTQQYWDLRTGGKRGFDVTLDGVPEADREFVIELFDFEPASAAYVHPAIDELFAGTKAAPTTLERFEDFWKLYPRKTAKAPAKKAWAKAVKTDKQATEIIAALNKQIIHKQLDPERAQFCPHASTWLNQERWTDELVPVVVPPRGRMFKGPLDSQAFDALAGVR